MKGLWQWLFGKSTPESDAQRFVKMLDRQKPGLIICGQWGYQGSNERYGWPMMSDHAFRVAVMKLLFSHPTIKDPRFSPPDSYDDWTFYATRIEQVAG